jgi:hypothetical protein
MAEPLSGSGEIKVPGVGNVDKKKALIGVAVIGGGIFLILYIRNKKSAATSQTAPASGTGTSTDAYPPDGTTGDPNDPYSTDPATGMTYGDEGNVSGVGLASGFGAGGYDTGGIGGIGSSAVDAAGYPVGSAADLQWQASQGSSTPGSSITTNSQWVQAALALLPGGASSANEIALQAVLAGTAVTAAQAQIFNEALALAGPPPGGYPPINQTSTAGQPSGGGSAGTPGGGTSYTPAGAISNLQATGVTSSSFSVHWNPAANAKQGYKWVTSGPGVSKAGSGSGTSTSVSGLKAKTTYNFGIQALPGGPGNNIHVTTT